MPKFLSLCPVRGTVLRRRRLGVLLAACFALASAQSTTLDALAGWQQVYHVRVADPSNPLYPGFVQPVDAWDDFQQAASGPLTAALGNGALRVLSQAQTDLGLHRVETTAIGISRDLAPNIAVPALGPNLVEIGLRQNMPGWVRQAYASSRVTDSFTAGATLTSHANLYAESRLGLQLRLTDARNDWYQPNGPVMGGMSAQSLLSYALVDVTPDASGMPTRQTVGTLDVTSSLQLGNLTLEHTTVVDQYSDRIFTFGATYEKQTAVFRNGVMTSNVRDGFGGIWIGDDNGTPLDHAAAGNYTADFNLLAGHRYELTTTFFCSSSLIGLAAFLQGTSAVCDGGHSAYWNGLSDIADAAGQPLATADVVSDGGFNYRWANPLSPSPDAILPSPVPEPGTWALLAAGAGVLALRARAARRGGGGRTRYW